MAVSSNAIKSNAKTALQGNWIKASVSSLVLVFAFLFNAYSTSLISIVTGEIFALIFNYVFLIFMIMPLVFGVLRFFWRLVSVCDDGPISVFYYFSNFNLYLKTLKFLLRLGLKLLPIVAIVFVPNLIIYVISQEFIFDLFDIAIPLWTRNLDLAILFVRTLSDVVIAIFALKYYISPFLFVANEDLDIDETLYMSSVVSKKTTLDFVFLGLSFIGWIIASVFVIPIVFTLPFMITSYVIHTKTVIAEYNNHVESKIWDNYPNFSIGV